MVKKVRAFDVANVIKLVKRTDYNKEVKELKKKIPNHDKCITTNSFIIFSCTIFDERLKQAKLYIS